MNRFLPLLLALLVTNLAVGAPAYPLDELLFRAKVVWLGRVAKFDGTNVTLNAENILRGDMGTTTLIFKVDATWGKPETGKRYFLFSQGHDHWGEPKNEIKLSQGLEGQGSYCGWIMLPIEKTNNEEMVKNAYSFKFRNPENGIGPLTLDQAKRLVRETAFKGNESKSNPPSATTQ